MRYNCAATEDKSCNYGGKQPLEENAARTNKQAQKKETYYSLCMYVGLLPVPATSQTLWHCFSHDGDVAGIGTLL